MTSRGTRHTSAAAAIAIVVLIAVAATRPSPGDPALQAKIACLEAEVGRLRAARTTATLHESPGAPSPSASVARTESPRKRVGAPGLRTLASITDRQEKLKLLRDLLHGSDAGLKSRALSTLRDFHDAEAAALVLPVLRVSGPSWLRAQAASVLGDIADPSALPALLEAAQSDDWDIRAGAASSLDRFGHAGPLQQLIANLVELLDHPDGGRREDAVCLLSSLQTPSALPGLVKALGDPTNSRIREAAADALGRSRLAAAIPYLETATGDPEPNVREAARLAIESLRQTR
jgi:HEAT repeat protein